MHVQDGVRIRHRYRAQSVCTDPASVRVHLIAQSADTRSKHCVRMHRACIRSACARVHVVAKSIDARSKHRARVRSKSELILIASSLPRSQPVSDSSFIRFSTICPISSSEPSNSDVTRPQQQPPLEYAPAAQAPAPAKKDITPRVVAVTTCAHCRYKGTQLRVEETGSHHTAPCPCALDKSAYSSQNAHVGTPDKDKSLETIGEAEERPLGRDQAAKRNQEIVVKGVGGLQRRAYVESEDDVRRGARERTSTAGEIIQGNIAQESEERTFVREATESATRRSLSDRQVKTVGDTVEQSPPAGGRHASESATPDGHLQGASPSLAVGGISPAAEDIVDGRRGSSCVYEASISGVFDEGELEYTVIPDLQVCLFLRFLL